jgi:diadenylate cyclase
MGLRHRAALGISEVCDAIAVVVSEETGFISLMYNGRIIRRLDAHRLENILHALFSPFERKRGLTSLLDRLISRSGEPREEEL